MTLSAEFDAWWRDLDAAALVGTARRAVPPAPAWPVAARPGAAPEVTMLDVAAVGSALRRAGSVPGHVEVADRPVAAAPDRLPLAPPPARQLLDLLLTQSPVGARLAVPAIEVWLREAARAGVRVHHATLVPLMNAATATGDLRPAVPPVLDSRGRWLAAANPDWRWALADTTADAPAVELADWPQLPLEQRASRLRALRSSAPSRARELVESTWKSDAAAARAELLAGLEVGLSLDDEPLLERALDDRAAGVREVACRLLDALPGSARAARLGVLLAPLLSTTGLVRKKIHVELPSDAGPAAVRDGLGKAPKGRSARGLWLQRLAAGAPFETWTDATGLDPHAIVHTLDDQDALAGLRAAALGRRDVTWSRALLDRSWHPELAGCLPHEELVTRMAERLSQVKTAPDLVAALHVAPGPWSAEVSAQVAARLGRVEVAPYVAADLATLLARRLHPGAAPAVQRLAASRDGGPTDPIHQLAQYLLLVPTITEAFR